MHGPLVLPKTIYQNGLLERISQSKVFALSN
jgi:hypothetical protein